MSEPTVFVVDDDPSVRRGLARLLAAAGMKVESFASATDFLAARRGDGPGCLVLDLRMPDMTGLELQEELGKAESRLPVIFLSAYGDVPATVRAMKGGAVDFLTKPVDRDELLGAIRSALARDAENRAQRTGSAPDLATPARPVAVTSFEQLAARSADGEAAPAAVLRAKLYRPPVAQDLLERQALLARLEAGRRGPLTLVSAPAGYGKTTLVSHWLETCEAPSAWLSLDEADGEVAAFLRYFVAAVRTLFPDACRETLALAAAPDLPAAEVLAACLSNELDRLAEPLVLALDDYHRLHGPGVHELLNRLLRRPPRGLHLVLVSRRDPPLSLLSLRGRQLMTEIRTHDLQFTTEETATFLEQALGHPVDAADLGRLQESTEGWPVALRLASLALRTDHTVGEPGAGPSPRERAPGTVGLGRDFEPQARDLGALARGITGDSWQMRQYLVAEVLSQQTPAVRDWLLRTSILERFCAPLVEAVCRSPATPADDVSSAPVPGDEEGGAALTPRESATSGRVPGALNGREFIDTLERKGLLCVALDERREWYRYHHLFREVLQSGLREQFARREIAALHGRAADWLDSQGSIDEALRHRLEGEGPVAAGQAMTRHRHEIMNREQWHRLDRWLSWLGPEAVGESSDLLLLRAWSLQNRGRQAKVWEILDRVETRLGDRPAGEGSAGERPQISPQAPEEALWAEIDALRGFQRVAEGRGDLALELARRALGGFPADRLSERGFATRVLALAHQMNGDLARANATIYDALAADPPASGTYYGRLLSTLCQVHWIAADLKGLRLAAARQLELGTELGLAECSLAGRCCLGFAQYHLGQLAAAEESLLPVAADRTVANAGFFAHGVFALAAVYEARARSARARETVRSVVGYALRTRNETLLQLGEAFSAELALRQGRIAEAVSWARQLAPGPLRPPTLFYAPEITRARVLLAEGGAESLDQADDLLRRLEELLAAVHHRRFLIETLALQALLREAEGDERSALELLGRAVSVAQPGRWIRPFVDLGPELAGLLHRLEVEGDALRYVGEILAGFQGGEPSMRPPLRSGEGVGQSAGSFPPPPADSQPLLDPLTPRELEILGLLAQRLSNREIAERLFISPGTVKRHTHSVYEKLGVSGRREAVTKALGLGVLGDR